MNKKYFSNNIIREARPRSKRLRDLGVSGSATALGSNIVSVSSVGVSSGGESHSHENKSYLDEITTSADGYLSLTKLKESEDGLQYNSVTEKVKSGYADKSAHSVEADHSKESDYAQKADYSKESGNAEKWDNNIFDDYLDQPLRSKDDVTFNIVISNVINAIEKITTEILNADNINVSNKIKTALAEITTKLSAKLIEAENIDVSDTITAFIADVITLYAQEADVNNLKAITANISESLKVKNQTVTGQISSLNYAEALLGWFIKQDGTAQLKGLKLLEFLDVPELRYNRVTVLAGESWRGPGAGLIESVDTENQIIYLKLVDGDKRTADIDDICKGIFHHAGGFQTVFFRPTEMVGETAFKYSLRPGTTLHPSAMMNFISYGNFTNTDRQKSVQETTSYKR